MKATLPLTAKILLIALVNVLVLGTAGAAFVEYELGREFGSVLLAAGGERATSVARQLALELGETAAADRDGLLDRYRRQYGVTFLLVDNNAARLGGPAVAIPPEVIERITEGPPDLEFGRGPPPGEAPTDGFVPPLPGTPPFLVRADGALQYWAGVRVPIRARGAADTVPGTLLLVSSSLLGNPFYFQPLPWLAIVLVTLGITAVCWLPFVRGMTRAISTMTRATAEIADGRFAFEGLPVRRDELGTLADAIRVMADRLTALVDGQRRFLADAAHELRSPLARISLALGLIEREAGEPCTRHVADLREDIEQMAALTDDLLAFARSELSRAEPRLESTNLHEVATHAARLEARDADVRIEIPSSIQVRVDPDLLVRAIANVVRNAVSYAGAAGPINISAATEGREVRLSVADEGPGIDEADLERVFSAFYRPGTARTRGTGGAGLGLAIARGAIESCGGSVLCRNQTPHGLEVSIRLPAA